MEVGWSVLNRSLVSRVCVSADSSIIVAVHVGMELSAVVMVSYDSRPQHKPHNNLRERERESLHLSSHTGLMQVLPGHPLANTITEY